MKKRIWSVILVVLSCLALLAGCGGNDQNPSDMLQAGSDGYADGKEEVEYELPGSSAKMLQELIDSYSAMRNEAMTRSVQMMISKECLPG